jgi:hypothetical protein
LYLGDSSNETVHGGTEMKLIVILLAGLYSYNANAVGPSTGGGGQGVVCYGSDGQVNSVQLLDLWEAEAEYGRTVMPSQLPIQAQVGAGLDNIKDAISFEGRFENGPDRVRTLLQNITDRFLLGTDPHFRRLHGVRLALTSDSYGAVLPKVCKVEQLVRYTDSLANVEILIDDDLFEKMNTTHQAALLVHEAFYALLRQQGELSSLRVRRAVGLAFSGHHFTPLSQFLPQDFYDCRNDRNQVFLYVLHDTKDGLPAIHFQISKAAGRKWIDFDSRASKYIPGAIYPTVTDFLDQENGSYFLSMGELVGYDYKLRLDVATPESGRGKLLVTLLSSPDEASPQNEEPMSCMPRSKKIGAF